MPIWHHAYTWEMASNPLHSFYGKALTKDEIVELRQDAEEAAHKLYVEMIDYIFVLEQKCRNLDRENRELRGRIG